MRRNPEPLGAEQALYMSVTAAPDLDCGDIPYRRFQVVSPDPHRFDGDHDWVGCES